MRISSLRHAAVLSAALAGLSAASAANAELIYGLGSIDSSTGSTLVTIDTANPTTATTVGPLTGGVSVRAIDYRPSNGLLYAVGFTTATNTEQLYTVSAATGTCTPVGAPNVLPTMSGSSRISLDFNPVTDELRMVSGNGGNVRLNPNTGALIATDGNIPAARLIAGIAYTNNFVGAATTTLYGYDFIPDQIVTIDGPTGTTVNVGSTGGPSAFGGDCGMDISGATGIAYLSMDDGPSPTVFDELYTVNLATGQCTIIPTGNAANELNVNLVDITVVPVPEPATVGLATIGLLGVARRRRG